MYSQSSTTKKSAETSPTMKLPSKRNRVRRNGAEVLQSRTDYDASPLQRVRAPRLALDPHHNGQKQSATQAAIAEMDLMNKQGKTNKVLLKAHLHQHLQIDALPHTDDCGAQSAHKTDCIESTGERGQRARLDLVHGSVDHTKHDGDERKQGGEAHTLACPKKNNENIEEGSEGFHRVRERYGNQAVGGVCEEFGTHHGDGERNDVADDQPNIKVECIKIESLLVENAHVDD